jgi:hypothetical protein
MEEGVKGLTRDKTRKSGKKPLPADTVQWVVASRIAEAQIDLVRVRGARHQLISRALGDPDYESTAIKRNDEAKPEGADKFASTRTAGGPGVRLRQPKMFESVGQLARNKSRTRLVQPVKEFP